MTPQELKNSIVQLAMRGRLVEQRTEDGSAEELYSLIQAEKKSKGIYDNKKMGPITEDIIPYDVPDNWCWVRFGDIVGYNMGKTPPRAEAEWWKPEYPWVSIADMPENGHITSTKECVSMSAINKKFGNKVTQAGTMIMSFKLTVGRVSILDIDAVHNEAIISIYPFYDADTTIQSYLFKLLPTVAQYGDTKNAIKGKTLNSTSICNLLIPLPPLAEQKRIVAKIEELLPYIDLYEQAWNKLEDFNKRFPTDMQKSILQMAIQGKLVEQRPEEGTAKELYQKILLERYKLQQNKKIKKVPDFSIVADNIPFEVPENWSWSNIETLTYAVGNKQNQIQTKEILPEGSLPVVSQGQSLIDGYTNQKEKAIDDLPLVMFGDHTRNVKFIDFPFAIGADGTKFHKCILVYPQYIYYWMTYASGRLRNRGYARHYVLLKEQYIPLPPLAEQQRIVAKLEEILPLCEKLK